MHSTTCPHCGGSVVFAHPPRFSIDDRYGKYRRVMKKGLLSEQESDDDSA
ncbi:MAG: nucleolar RNA-binding Nop10p family protein [Promethearchaeota archaeon]